MAAKELVIAPDNGDLASEKSETEATADWTEAEERSLVLNANALTDFFLLEVGITQNQFNIGQQLLSIGIVVLEIPSNLVLYRVGPTYWIGGQVIAWGLVATFQAFQKGLGPFLATRLLLGLCEAGFIPAALYTLTRWYKNDETTRRFSYFYLGSIVSSACSGLVAYGVLQLRGVRGLGGWQWLFLIEGLFTVVVGLVFVVFFPKSISNPVSIMGIRYLNDREVYIISNRVLHDDPTKAHAGLNVSWAELKATLTNWRLIPHVLLTICGLAPTSTMMSYAPLLVTALKFGRLKSNAMVTIGAWLLLITTVSWGWIADKWGRRGPLVTIGVVLLWGFSLGNRLLVDSTNISSKFALLTLVILFTSNWHPVNASWMASNAKTAGERSITMAIVGMAANASGIIGSQLFQQKDSPRYPVGWTAIVALASVALVASAAANLQYYLLNRRGGGSRGLYYT